MDAVRETRYKAAIREAINALGHASNFQLLDALRQSFPGLSATTVHRATARMLERGELGHAPSDKHGAMRFDAVVSTHDHFICNSCGSMRDITVSGKLLPELSEALGGCEITGPLVIYGSCKTCINKVKGDLNK